MAVRMRLARAGAKKRPYYKIVVTNSDSPRDGKFIERIGNYNPLLSQESDKRIQLDTERANYWLSVGAKPSERVGKFLKQLGLAH